METPVSQRGDIMGPRSLGDLLGGSEQLKRLRAEVVKRRELTERIRTMLPPGEALHLLTAHINSLGELVLVLDSPAWAARARYCQESLKRSLKPEGINRVRIQARPGS